MVYHFNDRVENGMRILPDCLYGEAGAGFLTEQNRRCSTKLQIPELNSGFDMIYWYHGCDITKLRSDEDGIYTEWDGEGMIPLTFVADVPKEGNYQVRIKLSTKQTNVETMIFLGRRKLAWRGTLKKNESNAEEGMHWLGANDWEGTFVTNICPIIPRTYTQEMEDLTLDVTILGKGVRLAEIEILPWKGKTLYIAGDSTVTDQGADYPYLPGNSYCGWGQMLSAFLGEQMAVSNHSHSGLTTESFRSEGHYRILLERISAGDICLFQFGHNDQKLMHLMAEGGYKENLIRYIDEIREKGAIPVIVTPLARNSWRGDDGAYNDLLENYAAVCGETAVEKDVQWIDLHRLSMDFILREGRESAKRYFYPADYTHSNDYGAYLFAGYIYAEMKRSGLLDRMNPGSQRAEPETWIPPEVIRKLTIPEAYQSVKNPNQEKLFENLERPEDDLNRVEALELVIASMHFFPTNVYNDMFEDVIGHETYAGVVECAWQNGLIPPDMIEEHKFFPQKKVTGREFLQILKQGYQSRNNWTDELEKSLLEQIASEDYLKRDTAAKICIRCSL